MTDLRKVSFLMLSIFLGAAGLAMADAPTTLNFQGKLTNLSGVPSSGSFAVVFSVWDAASGGNQLWTETQSVTVSNGIYNVTLGTGTALAAEVFTSSATWLQIKVGSDQPMTPRIKFNSVPYALKTQLATSLLSSLPVNDLFSSLNPVRAYVSSVAPYTVPAGKNLVIVSASGECGIGNTQYWGTAPNISTYTWIDRLNCAMPVSGAHTVTSARGYRQKNPVILGPGDVIVSTSSTALVKMKGFLIPASVSVILQDMPPGGTYTVPAGKTFYFGMFKTAENCSGSTNIDGFVDPREAAGVMTAGQTLTNNFSCTMGLNGYLR